MLDIQGCHGNSRLIMMVRGIQGQVGLGIEHTLHIPCFPLCIALIVSVHKAFWLLVLVVLVGEHVGVIGDAASIAQSLGTRTVDRKEPGTVDKIESVRLRCHIDESKDKFWLRR